MIDLRISIIIYFGGFIYLYLFLRLCVRVQGGGLYGWFKDMKMERLQYIMLRKKMRGASGGREPEEIDGQGIETKKER